MNEDYSKIELTDGTILNLEPKLNINNVCQTKLIKRVMH
ncbi:hypothetical protein EB14_00680 [Enterococcus faecium]|nr:hypothetical protein EB14_00680 [Enterococcus faecium]